MAKKKKLKGATSEFQIKRYVGLHLGGSKTDRTSLAVLEYYPKHKKLFLSRMHHQIGPDKERSSDAILHQVLTVSEAPIDLLALDAPLSLPVCMRCELKCPGYENCSEVEIKWMWNSYRKRQKSKKPNKIFSPYTQRCSELYVAQELEKNFYPPEALGSNMAPMLARAHFILRRITQKAVEVYPPLSLWRIGQKVGASKSLLNFSKHSVDGEENRFHILKKLVDSGFVFIYDQDIRLLSQNTSAFDALICGLTAYLYDIEECEPRPANFPKSESWFAIPK